MYKQARTYPLAYTIYMQSLSHISQTYKLTYKLVLMHLIFTFLLQRVSIACYAERCISHSKSVRPSVRLSVCLSVCPSHAGTESKRLKLRSWGLHCRI